MEKENNSAGVIGAVLLGAAIGGVLGVLFAPEKGTETRKKLLGNIMPASDENEEETESPQTESNISVGQNAM